MSENTYRIRTTVGIQSSERDKDTCLNVALKQTYDTLEILSLKLNQENAYKYYTANYGVIVGRVLANGGFGIPNAKIAVFIEASDDDAARLKELYDYPSTVGTDKDGVRYNVLPDSVDSACHQDVGTFPNKRLVLDNDVVVEVFDKYWKYTTTTNQSGDYMLFGIPTGQQTVHVDVDLSDCGILSQRPRDLIGQGYNPRQFESPNKFKNSTDLGSLAQIYSQDQGVFVYPYWGESDESGETIGITRCDINISYKFQPTCVFIGSAITDKGGNAIGKNCTGDDKVGRMSDLSTGEGSIEMIRKTLDNRVEEVAIEGNRLIDGDGVWCYQIPMNLDYVTTDEFGNMVPTDNPNKGIPTRTRVRFRITMDESPDDKTARKRCRYLVPNNPRNDDENPEYKETHEEDYEFGSATREESYRDLFWNKVYTVKSYIPKLQKNSNVTNRKHTGIKLINHFGDNEPMPYNSLTIKLSFMYRLICVITKVIIYIIMMLNYILGTIMLPFCTICNILKGIGRVPFVGWIFKKLAKPFCKMVISCIKLSSEFCDDGINKKTYYPGCWGCQKKETETRHNKDQAGITNPEERTVPEFPQLGNADDSTLMTCIENSLAQENDATSFNFNNDWVNGVLYFPLWYRKITAKKKFLFGLFSKKAKDQWCDANKSFDLQLFQTCAVKRKQNGTVSSPYDGTSKNIYTVIERDGDCGKKNSRCHETKVGVPVSSGLITTRKTLLDQTVYYYKSADFNTIDNDVTLLFATDIVLLGSLNDCDLDGIPQFYRSLEPTTYNMPSDILFTDTQIAINDSGESITLDYQTFTEATGADWGNLNGYDECGKMGKDDDGGLFYGIGCNSIEMKPKTVLNLSRICEYGVTIDNQKYIPTLRKLRNSAEDDDSVYEKLIPDGFISYDELYNHDERSMFATLNGNRLRTIMNKENGLPRYDLRHYYIDNFDGGQKEIMTSDLAGCGSYSYRNNDKLERLNKDYYLFRMGENPYFYNASSDPNHRFPRFENSFYFYFGLKHGKTAIEKFNSKFFAECETLTGDELKIGVKTRANDWCAELSTNPQEKNGFVKIDATGIATPYDVIINSRSDSTFSKEYYEQTDEKIIIAMPSVVAEGQEIPEGTIITEDKEGYSCPKDESEERIFDNLPNGEYDLTLIDADGEITSVTFSTSVDALSFNVSAVAFTIPNNQKSEKYNDEKAIRSEAIKGAAWSSETEAFASSFGGFLIIGDIINRYAPNGGCYALSVRPDETLTGRPFEDFKGLRLILSVDKNGTISIRQKSPSAEGEVIAIKQVPGIDGNQKDRLCIGVPKGDADYLVTLTQLCTDGSDCTQGIESNNSSTVTMKVEDPLPYKLYVNDVDIDIFKKDMFKTGWDIKTLNNGNGDINEVKGWLALAVDGGKYDWSKLPEFTKLIETVQASWQSWQWDNIRYVIDNLRGAVDDEILNEASTAIADISSIESGFFTGDKTYEIYKNTLLTRCNRVIEACNGISELYQAVENAQNALNIITFMEDYIQKIKSAFWMTCSSDVKDITVRLDTRAYPATIQLVYHDEEYDNEKRDIHKLVDINSLTVTNGETDHITDMGIPTITNYTNDTYGPKDVKNATSRGGNPVNIDKDLTFGYDRLGGIADRRNAAKYYKKPYFVAAYNGKDEIIPLKLTNTELTKNEVDNANRLDKFFSFHIIDKILRVQPVAWSYINNIPFFFLAGEYTDTAGNSNPYLGQTVSMNGLLAGYVFNGVVDAAKKFETQKLGTKEIQITTLTAGSDGENAIPTKRYIDYGKTVDVDTEYPAYKVIGNGSYPQYVPVPNRNVELNIEDGSCSIEEDIYGRMNIRAGGSSLADGNNSGNNVLQMLMSNGDTNFDPTYLVYEIKVRGNKHDDTNNKTEYPLYHIVKNENDKWVFDGSKYGVMAYERTLESMKTDDVDRSVRSVGDKDADDKDITNLGFSNSGKFTNIGNNKYLFVVAVTANNNRTFSPVYDFTPIHVDISIIDHGGGSYSVGATINNTTVGNHLYYIEHFDFNTNIYIPITSTPIQGSVDMQLVDEIATKVHSVGDMRDKDKTYAIAPATEGGQWTLYSYVKGWYQLPSAAGILPTTGLPDKVYLTNTDSNGNPIEVIELTKGTFGLLEVWSIATLDSLPTGATAYGGQDGDVITILISHTEPSTDGEGNPIPGEDIYQSYQYTDGQFVQIGEVDDDPTMHHYEKCAEAVITKEQYDKLKSLGSNIFGKLLIKKNSTITVTDRVGLPHICVIDSVKVQ